MALGFVYILLGQTFSTLASPTHQPPSLKLVLNPYPPSLHLQSQPSPSPSIFDLNPYPPSLRSQALTPHRHRTNEVRVLCLSLSFSEIKKSLERLISDSARYNLLWLFIFIAFFSIIYPWLTSTLSLACGSLMMLISWVTRIAKAPKIDFKFWNTLFPVSLNKV